MGGRKVEREGEEERVGRKGEGGRVGGRKGGRGSGRVGKH